MALKLDWNKTHLKDSLESMQPKIATAAMMFAQREANKLRAYMQLNRPWTDRTGEAKRRLNAQVSRESADKIRITLSHGVDYGYWLEVANERKYAIIGPTIKAKGTEVIEMFNGFIKEVAGGS